MGFQINHSEASEGKITAGTYEVIVKECVPDVTRGGTEHMSMPLIVRNDIDQKYKNTHIWNKVWKAKATGEYVGWVLQTIAKAAKLPNGKKYESVDDLFKDFVGKPVKVTISIKENNGYENINVDKWEPTDFPQVAHTWVTKDIGQEVNIAAEDIPF